MHGYMNNVIFINYSTALRSVEFKSRYQLTFNNVFKNKIVLDKRIDRNRNSLDVKSCRFC